MGFVRLIGAALIFGLAVTSFLADGLADEAAATSNAGEEKTIEGVFHNLNRPSATVAMSIGALSGQALTVDIGVADTLSQARAGDFVQFVPDDFQKPTKIVQVKEIDRPVDMSVRILALLGVAALIVWMSSTAIRGSPLQFIIGVDRRYSNSQTQLALWSLSVLTAYVATVVLRAWASDFRYIGGVGISENLLLLSGLSAFSFGGAKAITAQKTQGQPKPPAPDGPDLLTDLFQNDKKQADLGDFQMILITLIAVATFLVSVFNFLARLKLADSVDLPGVDSTILSAFGLGQGAYLFKKAALPPGDA